MHKSEPRVNPALITHANKVYKLIAGTTDYYSQSAIW